ncbi:MAG: DUF4145 domain-containing protein [Anaerolineales bacterium]|nr:MAG: DUF4145 domain-containing protein [Anaerolineales bacterium]
MGMEYLNCRHCSAPVGMNDIKIEELVRYTNGLSITQYTYECEFCTDLTVFWQIYGSKYLGLPFEISIWPFLNERPKCPSEVPVNIAKDYQEACLVLPISPKASAALSRRCLQSLLRESAKVRHSDLSNEIQEVIDSGKLTSQLVDSLDAVRNIGNFAAHPIKSKNTGEIFDIEPGEASWSLDVLEQLFDFYYVQPAKISKKREALNTKLKEAGKPPMK